MNGLQRRKKFTLITTWGALLSYLLNDGFVSTYNTTNKKGKNDAKARVSPQHSFPIRPGLKCRHDTIVLIGIDPDLIIRKRHEERLTVVLDLHRHTR